MSSIVYGFYACKYVCRGQLRRRQQDAQHRCQHKAVGTRRARVPGVKSTLTSVSRDATHAPLRQTNPIRLQQPSDQRERKRKKIQLASPITTSKTRLSHAHIHDVSYPPTYLKPHFSFFGCKVHFFVGGIKHGNSGAAVVR
jgi:hypothetical protein